MRDTQEFPDTVHSSIQAEQLVWFGTATPPPEQVFVETHAVLFGLLVHVGSQAEQFVGVNSVTSTPWLVQVLSLHEEPSLETVHELSQV